MPCGFTAVSTVCRVLRMPSNFGVHPIKPGTDVGFTQLADVRWSSGPSAVAILVFDISGLSWLREPVSGRFMVMGTSLLGVQVQPHDGPFR